MNAVFVDTAGLIALWNRSDQWHTDAKAAFSELKQARTEILTTSFVLLECGNSAARKPYRLDAIELEEQLKSRDRLVWPSRED